MLTTSGIATAYTLSENLASRGLYLEAVPQTPLYDAVNCSLVHIKSIASSAAPESIGSDLHQLLLEGSTFTDPLGGCRHDEVMEGSVRVVGDTIRFNLDLAKNVVGPIVKTVSTDLQKFIDATAKTALSPFNVVPFYYQKIWNSAVLHSLVNPYLNTPFKTLPLRTLDIQPPSNFGQLLTTGAEYVDSEIEELYQAIGGETAVAAIWNSVWGKVTIGMPNTRNLSDMLKPRTEDLNTALIVFLIARRYHSEIPTGVNMELTAWQAYLSEIRSQAGRVIATGLAQRDADVRNKRLVYTPVRGMTGGDLIVNGDVWTTFLKEGGSPELLFGAAHYEQSMEYATLLQHKERYLTAWTKQSSLLQATSISQQFSSSLLELRSLMQREMRSLPEERRIGGNPIERQNATLSEQLKRLSARDLDLKNLYLTVRRLVCRVMFPHTDAAKILAAIDDAAEANPTLDVREAALLATIDYAAEWICSLFEVKDARDLNARSN